MPNKERTIPPALMQRLLAFLTPGRFGQIVINVADGAPSTVDFLERVKVSDLTAATPHVDNSSTTGA